MAYRSTVRRSRDKRVFANTARNRKTINLAPRLMRGGVRL